MLRYFCLLFFCLCAMEARAEFQPISSYSLYLGGSVLYWQSHEQGLDFTNQPSPVFTTDNFTTTPLVGPKFSWRPGFRVTADFGFPCSNWALGFHWICYNGHAHKSTTAAALEGIFPVFSINEGTLVGDYATSAKINWKLRSNILDVLAENIATFGCRYGLATSLGVRNAWFFQGVHASYTGGSFNAGRDLTKIKSHFYGIGPRLGLVPWVYLANGFSFYAGGAVTAFYGFFRVHEEEIFVFQETGSLHRSPKGFRWNGDATAGMLWEYLFEEYCAKLLFDVGGNYLFFNRQNEFRRAEALGSPKGDLSLYGGHASLCLQF